MIHQFFCSSWRGIVAGGLLLLVVLISALPAATTQATILNDQTWVHVSGSCDTSVQGAVFAFPSTGCGGGGTAFDTVRIYSPFILQDVASAAAPCTGIANGTTCYRMWYTGIGASGVRRVGYAVSPDGLAWTRVPGAAPGGSVLGASGLTDTFDRSASSFPTVVKDGATFRMWYVGYDGSVFSVGYATSTNGTSWTRVAGPLAGGAVLQPSGASGAFDRDLMAAPRVMIDQASAAAPCESGRTSGVCYRMWYEGMIDDGGQIFRIGHALSPDGLNWTRIPGTDPSGAILGRGADGSFDENHTGVPTIIKDGAIYRLWYDAKDLEDIYRIGHVVSTDGRAWVRPDPDVPVYQGGDDPGIFSPDNVWSPFVLKDGPTYRMWYTLSTNSDSVRFGYAEMTPGTTLAGFAATHTGGDYTLSFTTAKPIPADGSVLLTLPAGIPFGGVAAGSISGFGAGATMTADPAAVGDAPARGITRGALVIRVPSGAAPGPKTVEFSLPAVATAPTDLLVQTFNSRAVLEYGTFDLLAAVPVVDLRITKTNGSTTAVPGTDVTYTIVVANDGQDAVSNAVVTDQFPPAIGGVGWTCAATAGSGCSSGGSGDIDTTVDLATGGHVTFTASGTIDSAATGALANTASVATPNGMIDPDLDNNSATDTDTLTPQADLSISKTSSTTSQVPGAPITYTIVVTNAGPSLVHDATVIDIFPNVVSGVGWTCAATAGSSCPSGGSGDINTTVDLVVGGRATFIASGLIDGAVTGTLANTASVTTPGGVSDPDTDNNSATVNGALAPAANLKVSNTDGVASRVPGTPISYTIVVMNTGPSVVQGAGVVDTFPATLSGVSWTCAATAGSSCPSGDSGGINANVDLAVGGHATFIASGTIDSAATGTLVNNASVTAPGGVVDPDTDDNAATDTDALTPHADLRISKTDGVASVVPGAALHYTIVVSNTGPSAVQGAAVVDTFPATLGSVSWTCTATAGSSCPSGGSGDINTDVDLALGGRATFIASAAVNPAAVGPLTNTASVTAPSGVTDPTSANNSATDTDSLTQGPTATATPSPTPTRTPTRTPSPTPPKASTPTATPKPSKPTATPRPKPTSQNRIFLPLVRGRP